MAEQEQGELILKTVVGSHIWGMQTPDSDYDYMEIRVAPTSQILDGTFDVKRGKFNAGDAEDLAAHEVGHVVNLLLTGNINMIKGVLSPIMVYSTPEAEELAYITKNNLAANIVDSIWGIAKSNYYKYIAPREGFWASDGNFYTGMHGIVSAKMPDGSPVERIGPWISNGPPLDNTPRRRLKIMRDIEFGLRILNGEGVSWSIDKNKVYSEQDVLDSIQRIYNARKESNLPAKPDPAPFRKWLRDLRRSRDSGE